MRLVAAVLLVLQTELKIASGEKEHVHFKIYVPEITKHHVHTRTVFIHVHEPVKKEPPKKNDYVESHRDDWSVWSGHSNYDSNGNRHESGGSAVGAYEDHRDGRVGRYTNQGENQGYVTPYEGLITSPGPRRPPSPDSAYPSYHRGYEKPSMAHYDDYAANKYRHVDDKNPGSQPVPPKSVFPNGVTDYSHPPRYEVRENVLEDAPRNPPESYKSSHEEGHSKLRHSEVGHLYTNESKNFYDEKREESSESVSAGSEEIEASNRDRDSYGYVGDNYLTARRMIR